ncbi:MAG: hypothetical protein RLZZ324_677 [Candidatus Parcubacteria bacterium]|jgi:prophage maintenance system killer protein
MKHPNKEVVVYQAANGAIALRGDFEKETMWATQAQIVKLFGVDQSVVARHILNIFKSGEVRKESNMQKMHITGSFKPTMLYSLDIVLAVGYRSNSSKAIIFRQWATKTLREHITRGFTINRKRIARNYDAFMSAVDSVRALAPAGSLVDTSSVIALIRAFADTWFSLDAYDRDAFAPAKTTKKNVRLAGDELFSGISELKGELVRKGEATELFATERATGSIAGIIGNVLQSFGGKELYPSIEEKAAHLLYFMVKNHPFTDGNKRSGAFAFAWFLQKAGVLDMKRLTPDTLTALTLLVAESDPRSKEKMTGLIVMLLRK